MTFVQSLQTPGNSIIGVATFDQGTVVQGDFGSRRLLSKEAFTSDKLAQISFLQALLVEQGLTVC